jgi:hypothetical protein
MEQQLNSILTSLNLTQQDLAAYGPWVAGGVLFLMAVLVFVGMSRRRRRRAEREAYDERVARAWDAFEENRVAPVEDELRDRRADEEYVLDRRAAPAIAPARAASPAERFAVTAPDPADVKTIAASSAPPDGRPWIELLMRPLRAGTDRDDAVVQFALTVGNTGSEPARDVRIATWMVSAGSAQESEMERMLIERPHGAGVSAVDIPAGDAARVEGELAMPRNGHDGEILPVVVAEARYRLPDGSEGRTTASFEIGRPAPLAPLPADRPGLSEDVVSRLHGEPERV